jgi:hypothetical protein
MVLYHLLKQNPMVPEGVVVGDGHEKEVAEEREHLAPVGGVVVAKTILHPAVQRVTWSEYSSGIWMRQLLSFTPCSRGPSLHVMARCGNFAVNSQYVSVLLFWVNVTNTSATTIRMRKSRRVRCMGDMRNVCKILLGKPDRKRPLRRSWHRWENNIEVDRRIIVLGVWIGFIWLRIRNGE